MNGFHPWQFLAGIAGFVYAMRLVESSLRHLAGRPFKKFLQRQAQNKLKTMAAATVTTAVLQSSSIVILMVLSFVGAGLLGMRGALAAVLGCNLGTTLDSWVIALLGFNLDLDALAFPLLAAALAGMLVFRRNRRWQQASRLFVGIAFLFVSLEWLKTSLIVSVEGIPHWILSLPYLAFIPVGLLLTSVIQSSSATIAITLAVLYNGLLPFENAAAVVIGSELGTTVKFLLASAGGIPDKKRVAWGNFILNVVTCVGAAVVLKPLVHLLTGVWAIGDPLIALVSFQSGINILSILLFYPFLGIFAAGLSRTIHDEDLTVTHYIGHAEVPLPEDALALAEKEVAHLLQETLGLNRSAWNEDADDDRSRKGPMKMLSPPPTYAERYERLKLLQGEILEFIAHMRPGDMNEQELASAGRLAAASRQLLRAAKNVKDIRHNLEAFESTANDHVYGQLTVLRKDTQGFYADLQALAQSPGRCDARSVQALSARNKANYESATASLLPLLRDGRITELDSSDLLNVFRELYSSNKALVQALTDLARLQDDEAGSP